MKQPKIKIFDNEYKVMKIEFNNDGAVEKVVYQISENINRTVFRGNKIINSSLTTERKIHEPTKHPYHDYAYAPNLESLLIQ